MTKRRDVVKLLEKNGFRNIGGKGHDRFVKKGYRTVVPRHSEVSDPEFRKIKKQAGLQ